MRLQNKTAIITGGGTGIGKAIALEFAKQGAQVATCGRRIEPLKKTVWEIENQGGKAISCTADMSSFYESENFLKRVFDHYGAIDVLVNNAGIALNGTVLNTPEHAWDEVLSIDLKGIFRMSKAVLTQMVLREKGKIINIASIAGLVGFPSSAAYCSAKAAVIGLTRQMAIDFGKYNININAIAPGVVETEMTKKIQENPSMKKAYLSQIPLHRFGKPEDIAHLAVYLASEESNFMTGQTIVVDGGWTIQ